MIFSRLHYYYQLLLRRTLVRPVRYSAYYFTQRRKVNKPQSWMTSSLVFASYNLGAFA